MTLAVLLAAGRGARLGQPKVRARLGDHTFLERSVGALLDGGVDEIVAVVPGDVDPEDLRDTSSLPASVRVLPNPRAERGQTSSVRLALANGTGDHALFLLHTVDRPLVRPADVSTLVDAFAHRPDGIRIVVPSVEGRRGHPALFESTLAAEFTALTDDDPAHRVLRRDPGRVHHVVLTDPWLVRDIDTPEDLADAEAALRERH